MQQVRLAEVMAALSTATDLAMGQPMEHAMASCLIAVRLGERGGLPASDLRDAYYQALLRYIGCNADASWLAAIVGDEIAFRHAIADKDMEDPAILLALLKSARTSAGGGTLGVLRALAALPQFKATFFPGHCEVAGRLAERLGFAASLVASIAQLYARWDGKGVPPLQGDAIALASQLASLSHDAATFFRAGGVAAVVAMARERSGHAHSPRWCDVLVRHAPAVLDGLDREPLWAQVLAAEPGEPAVLSPWQFDAACEAIGDYADMKSPYHLGHARRVAELAAAAARQLGLDELAQSAVRRAGWLHDIGHAGISAAVATQATPLGDRQREEARLHPYHTARILARVSALSDVARIASQHHECLDGSGYAQGLAGGAISLESRLLAAADRYCALGEPRAHRRAIEPDAIAVTLREQAMQGRLDSRCVEAVLACAGHVSRSSAHGVLTERECDVLRRLARGGTIKVVARELGLAPKTVDRHAQNIYAKIGVRTRAAAVLYAVEQGIA